MIKLHFGCGLNILDGFENVDIKDFDFNIFPYPYGNNYFDYIYSCHVLEHLLDPKKVIDELHRISKDGTIINIKVPYWNSKQSANDITHKHRFTERTFELICGIDHSYIRTKPKFEIIAISYTPLPRWKCIPEVIRNKIKDYISNIVYEISITLKVIK